MIMELPPLDTVSLLAPVSAAPQTSQSCINPEPVPSHGSFLSPGGTTRLMLCQLPCEHLPSYPALSAQVLSLFLLFVTLPLCSSRNTAMMQTRQHSAAGTRVPGTLRKLSLAERLEATRAAGIHIPLAWRTEAGVGVGSLAEPPGCTDD